MVKDFKYIIKRIIIGVGIALVLMFLKHGFVLNVHAKEISSVWAPFSSTNSFGLTNLTQQIDVGLNRGYWANWGSGKLRFNFTLIKVNGSATAPLVVPQNVIVNNYLCDINSTSTNNSTFTGQSYTATCPMIMGSNGLETLTIFFTPNQQNDQSDYRLTIGSMFTYEKDDSLNFDTSGTTSAINNQISNDNSNTQSIINNQNSNTEKEIESQQVCTTYDKSSGIQQGYFNSNGTINTGSSSSDYVITDFINITSAKLEALTSGGSNVRTCFFNTNKSFVSCINTIVVGELTIPTDATYVRFSIQKSNNRPTFKICQNGNQAIVNSQENINNTLNDDNVDTQQAGNFFSSFNHDSHGLSGVVTSPLRLINSLTTASCSPLEFNLPFVHNHVVLPCMKPIYQNYFGVFFSLWQLITTGLISYNVLINIYSKIHNLQNPNNDRIEVLNL